MKPDLTITKPTITGMDNNESGFSVTFKEGLDGNLDMKMVGLHIDAAGESPVYGAIEACANYLLAKVKEMKKSPQVEFSVDELKDSNGDLNCKIRNGKLIKR